MQKTRKIRLTPKAEMEMAPAATIGLMSGEIPFILVRFSDGTVMKLFTGQVMPVSNPYRLINPFQRSADVQVVLNAAPSITASSSDFFSHDTSSIEFNYSARHKLTSNGLGRGFCIFQLKAKSYIKILSSTDINVKIIPNFGPDAIAAMPPTFMQESNLLPVDGFGNFNRRVAVQSGYYDVSDFNPWMAYDGRPNGIRTVSEEAKGWAGMLCQGDALILLGGENKYFEVSLVIVDCGVSSYD